MGRGAEEEGSKRRERDR